MAGFAGIHTWYPLGERTNSSRASIEIVVTYPMNVSDVSMILLGAYSATGTIEVMIMPSIAALTDQAHHAAMPAASPIPVLVTNPSDPLVLPTLIVTAIGVVVSGAAAFFAWRSIVWARKDFLISSAQAEKADAERAYLEVERAKKPILMLFVEGSENVTDGVRLVLPYDANGYSVGLTLCNIGQRVAKDARVEIICSDGLTVAKATRTPNSTVSLGMGTKERLFVATTGIHISAPLRVGRLELTAERGLYTIQWLAQSSEGSWPVAADAGTAAWPKVMVHIT